jgi:short-subunit dehydrogenase
MSKERALITGASAGIGAAFAERLANDKYDLVMVARRRERLEALAGRLRAAHSIDVEVLAADLTNAGDLRRVEQRLAKEPPLSLLINNAGFGGYMPFVELDADRAEEQIRLHVIAVTRLTRAALASMVARKHGAVINVSSRLAFSGSMPSPPLPKRATYAASKAYINTFTQILADELAGTGVHVQALCPGLVKSEFHAGMNLDYSQFPPGMVMMPEAVAAASLECLARGEVFCLPGLQDYSLVTQISEAERRLLEPPRR